MFNFGKVKEPTKGGLSKKNTYTPKDMYGLNYSHHY